MTLTGKVALVTGGARGIGRGIALRLARDGADIALVDVRPDGINSVADEITEIGCKATTFVADVGERDQVLPSTTPHRRSAASTSWSTTPVSPWWGRSPTSHPTTSRRYGR
jgi:meso-butanediol dehydrogenase / (S,S)-butanediol dehydrogenase / diacetyl reductase